MRNQGQGHIRQRGKQSWQLKFDLGRDPATGKRITRLVTFRGTKREAQAELNRLLNRRNEGTYVDPTKMSVAEYLEHWLSVDIERRVARKTVLRHRGIIRHNIIPLFRASGQCRCVSSLPFISRRLKQSFNVKDANAIVIVVGLRCLHKRSYTFTEHCPRH